MFKHIIEASMRCCCRENLEDDMSQLVIRLRPHRWKVFQVGVGQGGRCCRNDGKSGAALEIDS
jgi:hypothetical protein